MGAGASPQQHRVSTGIFASKLCSSGWKPGSSGKARKNGTFNKVRKCGSLKNNISWFGCVLKVLVVMRVIVMLQTPTLSSVKTVPCSPPGLWVYACHVTDLPELPCPQAMNDNHRSR